MTRRSADGLKELLQHGLVRGKLSTKTLQFIKKEDIIRQFRELTLTKGKGVFKGPHPKKQGEVEFDHKRRMIYFSSETAMAEHPKLQEAIQMICEDVRLHILFSSSEHGDRKPDKLYCKLDVRKAAVSIMIDGYQQQCTHTDYDEQDIISHFYSETASKRATEQMPVVLLLSLEPGTKLGYHPGSHNVVLNKQQRQSVLPACVLELDEGEFVLIHPLLLHYGCVYAGENTRVHLYIDSPLCPRKCDAEGQPLTFLKKIASKIDKKNPHEEPYAVSITRRAIALNASKSIKKSKRERALLMQNLRNAKAEKRPVTSADESSTSV